ncbi:DNA/RNA non-specific endonuclease [uncultured Roseovarius sp.]|uniref:DNA/RNA non-specific endonuclease n=1 Tax=uncultured Roseovarius sp. TaxID=293344 RepID=UPI0026365274|nr:DNA/RNA non-specific endonuclease [uncultured Roseovarius sp.]
MTDSRIQESIARLGTFAQDGTLDAVLTSSQQGNPLIDELGLSIDSLKDMIETPPHQLQNRGESPVRMEAIIELIRRPPLIVENGKVTGKDTLSAFFDGNISGDITAVEKFIPSIGRIEFLNHARGWGGTGWVIEDKGDTLRIVTNRHVAKIVAQRTFRGDAVYAYGPGNVKYGAQIDFGEEANSEPDPAQLFAIHRFTYLADDISADVAIGEIDKPADVDHIAPLPLAGADGQDGETVATVGYPAYDTRNAHVHMERYFKGLYDVKRFAPGLLIATGDILSHDCTTLGGNSGSPLLSLDSATVVGLHFAGAYRKTNSAVRVSTLKALLAGNSHAAAVADHASGTTEAADRTHDASHFEGRRGYDPDFLRAASVPLPVLPDALGLATPSDATPARPHELRYQHFGVLYSAPNKGPAVTAFNLDGALFRPIKRHNSTWFHDLRIPRDIQLDREDYGHADIDRGHMVRRYATNWGTEDEAMRANLDSYHYTNAAPQHRALNRSWSKWLGLENYVLESARTHGFRANVFTGPVYTPGDKELGKTGAPLPTHFWKVLIMLATGPDEVIRLHATAYMLSQGQLIQDMLLDGGLTEATEGFEYGEYKTFQIRIRDLEAMTGYDFGPLRDFDPLNRLAQSEATFAAKPVIEIDYLEQIVLGSDHTEPGS